MEYQPFAPPCPENGFHSHQVELLLSSYLRLLGQPLLPPNPLKDPAQQVFEAKLVVLSHDTAADPLFNYANRTALTLFETRWQDLIGMPSRFSAEPVAREERERLLAEVSSKGYIDHYSGVRISKTGKRFLIRNAVVWNLSDENLTYRGQAACFSDWTPLD